MSLAAIVASIMERPGPVRIVAIDGPGGAGKTTLAQQLSDAAGGAPVVHTDDFATRDGATWWPRFLEQVIEPLINGAPAQYQRYDWVTGEPAEWHTVEQAPIVIIEGVSSARGEWASHLSFVVWVETPRNERLRRGLERDGIDARSDWDAWMAEEDVHFANDPTRERADLVVDGTSGPPR